jgi:hypothetical protein
MFQFMFLDKTPKSAAELVSVAHLCPETSKHDATCSIHALQNLIAEMMVPCTVLVGVLLTRHDKEDDETTKRGVAELGEKRVSVDCIRECDVPLVGRDLISMERSLTWWNPKPRHTKCVILIPSLISSPQSVTFQVWRWNKITDFIPKLLDFEITVNLTVDFIPNG